jgi:DNA-binding PadR family transcriptional regulator
MLEYILLGLLLHPRSGYELKARFREGASHFWHADLSQIYRTLQRLEEKGWLTSGMEPSESGPDRRVYTRTASGAAALHDWLALDPIEPTPRLPYVAQLYFLSECGDLERTREFLRAAREQFQARVAALEAIDYEMRGTDDRAFHILLTLRLGIATARARLDWCNEALRQVGRRLRKDSVA